MADGNARAAAARGVVGADLDAVPAVWVERRRARKICKRLNLPVPPRGYWAKVEAGHKVRKAALPKDAEQSVAQIHVAPKPVRTEADDEDDAWLAERVAFERAEANAITVVTIRKRWHPASSATARVL